MELLIVGDIPQTLFAEQRYTVSSQFGNITRDQVLSFAPLSSARARTQRSLSGASDIRPACI